MDFPLMQDTGIPGHARLNANTSSLTDKQQVSGVVKKITVDFMEFGTPWNPQ